MWSVYDTFMLLTGIVCCVVAVLPVPGVAMRRRLGFGAFGFGIVALSLITGSLTSFTYPSLVMAGPFLAAAVGAAVLVEGWRKTRRNRLSEGAALGPTPEGSDTHEPASASDTRESASASGGDDGATSASGALEPARAGDSVARSAARAASGLWARAMVLLRSGGAHGGIAHGGLVAGAIGLVIAVWLVSALTGSLGTGAIVSSLLYAVVLVLVATNRRRGVVAAAVVVATCTVPFLIGTVVLNGTVTFPSSSALLAWLEYVQFGVLVGAWLVVRERDAATLLLAPAVVVVVFGWRLALALLGVPVTFGAGALPSLLLAAGEAAAIVGACWLARGITQKLRREVLIDDMPDDIPVAAAAQQGGA
jgi:hypothetical protein